MFHVEQMPPIVLASLIFSLLYVLMVVAFLL